jgi:hypothetical protein
MESYSPLFYAVCKYSKRAVAPALRAVIMQTTLTYLPLFTVKTRKTPFDDSAAATASDRSDELDDEDAITFTAADVVGRLEVQSATRSEWKWSLV